MRAATGGKGSSCCSARLRNIRGPQTCTKTPRSPSALTITKCFHVPHSSGELPLPSSGPLPNFDSSPSQLFSSLTLSPHIPQYEKVGGRAHTSVSTPTSGALKGRQASLLGPPAWWVLIYSFNKLLNRPVVGQEDCVGQDTPSVPSQSFPPSGKYKDIGDYKMPGQI